MNNCNKLINKNQIYQIKVKKPEKMKKKYLYLILKKINSNYKKLKIYLNNTKNSRRIHKKYSNNYLNLKKIKNNKRLKWNKNSINCKLKYKNFNL